jgi:hypothetical protein
LKGSDDGKDIGHIVVATPRADTTFAYCIRLTVRAHGDSSTDGPPAMEVLSTSEDQFIGVPRIFPLDWDLNNLRIRRCFILLSARPYLSLLKEEEDDNQLGQKYLQRPTSKNEIILAGKKSSVSMSEHINTRKTNDLIILN